MENENPIYKWMMKGYTPISGNLHMTTKFCWMYRICYFSCLLALRIFHEIISHAVETMPFNHPWLGMANIPPICAESLGMVHGIRNANPLVNSHNYWTISIDSWFTHMIFQSYVRLPEGTTKHTSMVPGEVWSRPPPVQVEEGRIGVGSTARHQACGSADLRTQKILTGA